MRDAEISSGDIPPAWLAVIGGRRLVSASFCEFGPAEETVGLLAFADGTYEVGVGESLRPYARVALTDDRREAHRVWWEQIRTRTDDEE